MNFEEERERRLIAEEYAHSNNCSIVSNELLRGLQIGSRKVVRDETATYLERLVYLLTKEMENRGDEENSFGFVARLFVNGYTVEEEQKYYVLLPEIVDNWRYVSLAPNHWGVTVRYTDTLDDVHEFTEQEIKDYDERYWPFAVPVEEGEE